MAKIKPKTKQTVLAVFLCIAIGIGVFFACEGILKVIYPLRYTAEIEAYAKEYDVPKALMYAVIHTESGFDPKAKSGVGAIGLTQIMPETFLWLQEKSGEGYKISALYEPDISIQYGTMFYGMLLEEFEDTKTAIAAYHAGQNKVRAWLQDKNISPDGKTLQNIPEGKTKNYVEKVQATISIYENLYKEEIKENE